MKYKSLYVLMPLGLYVSLNLTEIESKQTCLGGMQHAKYQMGGIMGTASIILCIGTVSWASSL